MKTATYDLELTGCTPTPLAHYLKALGILRLVSEQIPESQAQGWWQNDTFWLRSTLDREALIDFFLNDYSPSPIVGPWGARSGFFSTGEKGDSEGAARTALDRILQCQDKRLDNFRHVIRSTMSLIKSLELNEKPEKGEENFRLMLQCRNQLPDQVIHWLDATLVLIQNESKFPPLLGTGGNEGSGSYMSGFTQHVVTVLIDRKWDMSLSPTLFGTNGCNLYFKQTPGHFLPDATGGPNSNTGFSADKNLNLWDYLLGLEGSLMFAASAVKRLEDHRDGSLSYPFCVRTAGVGYESADLSDESSGRAEMWLPLWRQPTNQRELESLLSEGRAIVNRRKSKTGIDFARAIGTLGIDRGISKFERYGFHQRNGLSNFAVPLGEFHVESKRQSGASLLEEQNIDQWLSRFRSSLTSNSPARASRALRAIETAILKLCQRGNPSDIQQLLIALGEAEATIAISPKLRDGEKGSGLSPVPLLKMDWLAYAYDSSREFRLAAALASLKHDDIGPIRKHLEPIDLNAFHKRRLKWLEVANSPSIVWTSGNLVRNLNAVLNRRLMEGIQSGKQQGDQELLAPLKGSYPASLSDIHAFIHSQIDEQRLEALFKGLMLLDWKQPIPDSAYPQQESSKASSPDAGYALLKLCHPTRANQEPAIKLQPQITTRAFAGDAAGATTLAARRLRISGIPPAINQIHLSAEIIKRTTAALMFPISRKSEEDLKDLITARHLKKSELV
ncbi:type I-U CRISPR-associated protein Csx17 [Rubinisphaera sp.]|uniref:type I-G CRISPR-associated protein Cas8g1/Csx17 n=1 Tax=Rubinisphaera sp. TaxID=2024857 RepID=UPI000C0DFA38|nr:type I-U CRISPR-associated protein Csx17 [Rubinisphaera sp.]MBV10240.1 type I-U CRISPR-associated protein Csx17 [Rubinisphaera sp.]HCS54134.1 type I-U CRISPR-associated protein Csx17 [Planctomycetaceae bacterium]|tara:strand:- start:3091 stop:5283 length:2193 start_codon:yes stop_codon:yes gene_type:complete